MEFDQHGRFIKSFGSGLFVFPHSLLVDKDDNIWITDCGVKNGKGNQVFKLSSEGKVLLTLGQKGVLGGSPDNFVGPTDVTIAPNGEIFVADGHAALALGGGEFYGFAGKAAEKGSRMRILKFAPDGKFLMESERTDLRSILIPGAVGGKGFVGNGERIFAGLGAWFANRKSIVAAQGA